MRFPSRERSGERSCPVEASVCESWCGKCAAPIGWKCVEGLPSIEEEVEEEEEEEE